MYLKTAFKSWMTWAYFALVAWASIYSATTGGTLFQIAVFVGVLWFMQYCWWHVWQLVKRLAQKAMA